MVFFFTKIVDRFPIAVLLPKKNNISSKDTETLTDPKLSHLTNPILRPQNIYYYIILILHDASTVMRHGNVHNIMRDIL